MQKVAGLVVAVFVVVAAGCSRLTETAKPEAGSTPDQDGGTRTSGAAETAVGGGNAGSDPDGQPAEACRGAGHYESGKEGSYLPCCDGLTEVFQQKAAYDGDGNPVCSDPPLRVYACVAGECGDGVCEVGEDKPCGCVQDCPGAIWEDAEDSGRPVSCEPPDDTDACRFAQSLMRCKLPGGVTEVCLGECPDADATNCSNDCRPDEYAAMCGGIGPTAPPADPPPGCGNAQHTPGGATLYCCSCQP